MTMDTLIARIMDMGQAGAILVVALLLIYGWLVAMAKRQARPLDEDGQPIYYALPYDPQDDAQESHQGNGEAQEEN